MQRTCSDQPIPYIWPNFEGILCNLDDVVHMNRGLPNEWRSFSPLTSNITSHLWDCSKDCPHLHSLHFVTHRKRKKWFISVNVNILKIHLTSEEYNKLIGYWLSQSDSAVQDIRSDHLQNHLHQYFSHHWQKIIIVIVWILSQNWCVCLALGLPAVYEMRPSSSSSASSW